MHAKIVMAKSAKGPIILVPRESLNDQIRINEYRGKIFSFVTWEKKYGGKKFKKAKRAFSFISEFRVNSPARHMRIWARGNHYKNIEYFHWKLSCQNTPLGSGEAFGFHCMFCIDMLFEILAFFSHSLELLESFAFVLWISFSPLKIGWETSFMDDPLHQCTMVLSRIENFNIGTIHLRRQNVLAKGGGVSP